MGKNLNFDLAKIRDEYKKAPRFSADQTHEAFIVKIFIGEKRFTIGVNYWTKSEAAAKRKVVGRYQTEIIAPLYL